MKTKILSLIAVIIMALTAFASVNLVNAGGPKPTQPPVVGPVIVPDELPFLASARELRAWAVDHIASINLSAYSASSIRANTNDRSYVNLNYVKANGVTDVDEVLSIIGSQNFQISVLYSKDIVYLYGGLNDAIGYNLFYGDTNSPITVTPNGGTISTSAKVRFRMNDRYNFPFAHAQYAYVVERDEDGNVTGYVPMDVNTWNGPENTTISGHGYYSGKTGEVIIGLDDGTEVAYGLGKKRGKKLSTTTVRGNFVSSGIEGVDQVKGVNVVYVPVTQDEFDRNVAPVVRFVNTTNNNLVAFSSWLPGVSPYGYGPGGTEYATSVTIWKQGASSSTAQTYAINGPAFYVQVMLDKGPYWVMFNYPSDFGEEVNEFGQPYKGGSGKGG